MNGSNELVKQMNGHDAISTFVGTVADRAAAEPNASVPMWLYAASLRLLMDARRPMLDAVTTTTPGVEEIEPVMPRVRPRVDQSPSTPPRVLTDAVIDADLALRESPAPRRGSGQRGWTDAQRAAASAKFRKMHADRKANREGRSADAAATFPDARATDPADAGQAAADRRGADADDRTTDGAMADGSGRRDAERDRDAVPADADRDQQEAGERAA